METSTQEHTQVTIAVEACPVQQAIIYNDRAEVTRLATFTHLFPGPVELSIVGLSSKVDRNSVRVSGQGSATILEVSYNTKWRPKNNDNGSERATLQRTLEELNEKIDRETEALARIEKEREWVNGWAQALSQPRTIPKGEGAAALFSSQALEQAMSFMQFYQKSLADIDNRCAGVQKSMKALREKHEEVSKSLSNLVMGDMQQVHELNILVNIQAQGDLPLELAYVVMDASWHAAYDVRVQSDDLRLELTYYGIITNTSLDDWHNALLALSTAKPSVSGAPPDLTTKFVGFAQPFDYSHGHSAFINSVPAQPCQSAVQEAFAAPAEVLTTSVQESSTCHNFEIPRKATILSDSKAHKVTIGIIKLKASFTYLAIPRLSLHAYLKASIVNRSDYSLLGGDINVFMDGNFIAKSSIKGVSPTESFVLFLGTDDSIKITNPPGVFFKDTQGILRRSNLKTLKHLITIKNTKSKEVEMLVYDQLPKSNSSQIKVHLTRPVLAEQENVRLTEANNLEWDLRLKPGQQIQLPFEYQIEWPVGVEINI